MVGAATLGYLQRDVAAERVADDVGGLEPGLVHRPLDPVGEHLVADLALDRRAAGVAGEGQREHVVLGLELRQDQLPAAPGVGEPVQADHRRAGAAAVNRGEGGVHGPATLTRRGPRQRCRSRILAPMVFAPPARHLLRAKDLADARYFEHLDVDDLARAAGLSRAHFSREFRRAFGESPHGYLLTRRLERAAALLRTTDNSVAEICFSVGLQSVGSFTSSFTRTYGVSPTAYRARFPPASALAIIPACVMRAYARPQHSTFGEDKRSSSS